MNNSSVFQRTKNAVVTLFQRDIVESNGSGYIHAIIKVERGRV